jgi:hypothetical protein
VKVSHLHSNHSASRRTYDLRHTCLTNWLNSGVPAAQVAEWAGNSVPVLLSTYVNCIAGTEEEMKRRVLGSMPGGYYFSHFPELSVTVVEAHSIESRSPGAVERSTKL